MKILAATIYGFGKWRDFSLSFTNGKINLVLGENEAGKSTIQQFLLFMLFGLSPKEREFFQPRTGGPVGGNIHIETDDYGEVFIERIHDKRNGLAVCRLSNGEEFGEEWLSELLGGLNRSVYESIYTFNAEDLAKLRNISGSELGEVLLNTGLTGADQIFQTEKWLDKQVSDRFKPKGKVPEINQQLKVVEDLAQKLSKAESEEGRYKELLEKKHTCQQELQEVERALTKGRKEQYSYQQMIKALPMIQEYHQLCRESEGDERESLFPERGRERYQELKEKILPLESEQHMLEERRSKLQEKVEKLLAEQASEENVEQAAALMESQKRYNHALHDREQLNKRFNDLRKQVDHELSVMNIPVHAEELNDYQFPFYIEETWRNLKNESKSIDRQQESLREQEESLHVQKEQVRQRLHELENVMISEEEAAHYAHQMDTIVEFSHDHLESSVQVRKRRQRAILINFSIILISIGWLTAFLTANSKLGIGATLAGMLLCLAAYFIHRAIGQSENDRTGSQPKSRKQEAFNEVQRKLQTHEKNKAEWAHLQQQWKQLSQEDIKIEEKHNHILQQTRRLEAGIQEERTLYPFLNPLPIDYWEKLYHLLIQVQNNNLVLQQVREQLSDKEEDLLYIERKLDQFFENHNGEKIRESINNKWAILDTWTKRQYQIQEQLAQLQADIHSTQEQVKQLESRLHPYYIKREELFSQAGTSNEEDFYFLAKQHEVSNNRSLRKEQLANQMINLLTPYEQEVFAVWERTPEESSLKFERDQQTTQLHQLEGQQKRLQEELADIRSALTQLENSEQRSAFRHHFETEKAKLQEQAKEWAQYQIALQMLTQTKNSYRQKFLPKILQIAGDYFTILTYSRYQRLYIDPGTQNMLIESQDGQVYKIRELSRGTNDQLYISIRLALSEVMSETMGLPFIIDDAFVHFDKARLKVMLNVLQDHSRKQQIILFTWRKDLVGHLKHLYVQDLKQY